MGQVKNDIEFSRSTEKLFKDIEKGLNKVSQKLVAKKKHEAAIFLYRTNKVM